MKGIGKLILKGLELIGITDIGGTYTGYKSLFINTTTNKIALGDVPGGGVTVLQGFSAEIAGDLIGNTNYTQTFTVTGAVVGDKVTCGFNDTLYDTLKGASQRGSIKAKVVSANTVEVTFQVESFLGATANWKTWARIVK